MTTFELEEVRGFAAELNAQMDRCDNGEGMECATLESALRHYAGLCCRFRDRVREWGRAVFYGHAAFDPQVETAWLDEGLQLYMRAFELWKHGQRHAIACYMLEGQIVLQAALWDLHRLIKQWVSPKRAVGLSARLVVDLDPAQAERVRRQIESLPPLPADWRPDDPQQQRVYRMLKNS